VRSYCQYCSVAKALDVVGDRWTLLIVRELLLRGSCRYTDLRNGLPGIATNLLAARLRELEGAGLVRREEAPPPIATTLFSLTPRGAELQPVVEALGRFGIPYMSAEPAPNDEFRGPWLSWPAQIYLRDREPAMPAVAIELRTEGGSTTVEAGAGELRARPGAATNPDAVVSGSPPAILRLLSGGLAQGEELSPELELDGDLRALRRVLPRAESTAA
jgi:DNA-binding HxlR family transcriptional regulator